MQWETCRSGQPEDGTNPFLKFRITLQVGEKKENALINFYLHSRPKSFSFALASLKSWMKTFGVLQLNLSVAHVCMCVAIAFSRHCRVAVKYRQGFLCCAKVNCVVHIKIDCCLLSIYQPAISIRIRIQKSKSQTQSHSQSFGTSTHPRVNICLLVITIFMPTASWPSSLSVSIFPDSLGCLMAIFCGSFLAWIASNILTADFSDLLSNSCNFQLLFTELRKFPKAAKNEQQKQRRNS